MIKKILILIAVVSVPAVLGLLSWQSARYSSLSREVSRLEREQDVWLEGNKRLIAGISMLSSVERIEKLARDELSFSRVPSESIMQVEIGRGGSK